MSEDVANSRYGTLFTDYISELENWDDPTLNSDHHVQFPHCRGTSFFSITQIKDTFPAEDGTIETAIFGIQKVLVDRLV